MPDTTAQLSAGRNTVELTRRGLQLLLLSIALISAVYAKMALGPLQETLRGALSLDDNQIALLQGPALAFPMLLIAVPLGLIIDRRSRVKLLFFLALFALLGSLLTAVAPNFAVLFAARALVVRIPRDREQVFHGMVNTDSTAT
jgi:predicted MFS family arabinose efflux permease